jgi:hypothetical protein
VKAVSTIRTGIRNGFDNLVMSSEVENSRC